MKPFPDLFRGRGRPTPKSGLQPHRNASAANQHTLNTLQYLCAYTTNREALTKIEHEKLLAKITKLSTDVNYWRGVACDLKGDIWTMRKARREERGYADNVLNDFSTSTTKSTQTLLRQERAAESLANTIHALQIENAKLSTLNNTQLSTIQSLDAQKSSLEDRLRALTEAHQNLTNTHNTFRNKSASHIQSLRTERQSLKDKITDLETHLDSAASSSNAAVLSLGFEIRRLTDLLARKDHTLTEVTSKSVATSKKLTTQITHLEIQLKTLNEKLHHISQNSAIEITSLKHDKKLLTTTLDDISEDLDTLRETSRAEIRALTSENETLAKANETLTFSNTTLQTRLTDLSARFSRLECVLSQSEKEKEEVEVTLAAVSSHMYANEDAFKAERDVLLSSSASLKRELDEVKEREEANGSNTMVLSDLVAVLERDLEGSKELKTEVEVLRARLGSSLRKEASEREGRIRLEKVVEELRERLEKAYANLRMRYATARSLEKEKSRLEPMVVTLKTEIRRATQNAQSANTTASHQMDTLLRGNATTSPIVSSTSTPTPLTAVLAKTPHAENRIPPSVIITSTPSSPHTAIAAESTAPPKHASENVTLNPSALEFSPDVDVFIACPPGHKNHLVVGRGVGGNVLIEG
ncbi:hypothetical protein HK097_010851, partial [Rhizophlyctis rosea]